MPGSRVTNASASSTARASSAALVISTSGGAAPLPPTPRTPWMWGSSSAAREPGAAAHRRAAVAELLRLHRLPLAAVRDRVEAEVKAHRVHVHEGVARVGHDAAVPGAAPERRLPDLVDPAGGDAEDLLALRHGT